MPARGVELKCLKENIDTTTPTGMFMFHIMAALAEFERDLISEPPRPGWRLPEPGDAKIEGRYCA